MQPPIEELVRGRPDSWLGLPLEWLDDAEPVPHFVQTFEVEGDVLYLFEARYGIATVLVDGESFGDDGHFIEYFVVTGTAGSGWSLHRLLQRGGLTYCASGDDEDPDTIPAREVRDPGALSLGDPPAWKASEAQWPTHRGAPLTFIGQTAADEGATAFLFWNRGSAYKIFEQHTDAQTAEEHYALEERRDAGLR